MSEKNQEAKDQDWWKNGVQFECQGSGKCCVSHGEYGFVYVPPESRRRLAQHLGLSTAAFTRKYCVKTEGFFHLKDKPGSTDCLFLDGKRCSVYEARPTQCRTWPWWPEVMSAKAWKRDVASFCPGVGKGRTWSAEEIETNLKDQARSETRR